LPSSELGVQSGIIGKAVCEWTPTGPRWQYHEVNTLLQWPSWQMDRLPPAPKA